MKSEREHLEACGWHVEIKAGCGFISPTGDFWPVHWGEHQTFASDLSIYHNDVYHKMAGWLIVGNAPGPNNTESWFVIMERSDHTKATAAQVETLRLLSECGDGTFAYRMLRSYESFKRALE